MVYYVPFGLNNMPINHTHTNCVCVCLFVPRPGAKGPKSGLKAQELDQRPKKWAKRQKNGPKEQKLG